ncbi:MAG: hypothetical protein R3C42_09550 [Parvularculaceae bacterium]
MTLPNPGDAPAVPPISRTGRRCGWQILAMFPNRHLRPFRDENASNSTAQKVKYRSGQLFVIRPGRRLADRFKRITDICGKPSASATALCVTCPRER